MTDESFDLVVTGGGPAGMMAGLLFARAGASVCVIEKHADFLRDFRGDTVHPSTLELFHELGLLDGLLAEPHDKVTEITGIVAGTKTVIADFSHLPVHARYIAMMPQWHFLNFTARAAERYPGFRLRMSCEADGVIEEAGRIVGVTTTEGEQIRGRLTLAADGRRSILRDKAALPLKDLGAPMDVFWFRIPKVAGANQTTGIFDRGHVIAMIDRGDYWQCAWVFAKGAADEIRARGLDAFKADVAGTVPVLAGNIDVLQSWDDIKLLTVALDRLERWHRPGLLAIGDAAHAMSPIGGVGINLAVQDAVAAANILAGPLAAGKNVDALLDDVQRRRMLPTRVIQGMQKIVQDRLVSPTLVGQGPMTAPWPVRALRRWPVLRRLPARLIGLGVRREHIRSPEARSGSGQISSSSRT